MLQAQSMFGTLLLSNGGEDKAERSIKPLSNPGQKPAINATFAETVTDMQVKRWKRKHF